MRPDAALSKFLAGGLVPLCIWGAISALVLHLLEIRSLFVAGGETRLRVGILAFALGAILVQRLAYLHGKSAANAYTAVFLGLITIFAAQIAYMYRTPFDPWIVLAVNESLFLALWFAARRITAACSVDSEAAVANAGESGAIRSLRAMYRVGRRKPNGRPRAEDDPSPDEREKQWREKLPSGHPATTLLWFSLVAIPLFGLGSFLFAPDDSAHFRMGILFFVYLWCAASLLFLATLGQIRAYFETRGVSLPEQVGLPWIAIGFAVATFVLVGAFLLPQPASPEVAVVRNRIQATWRGMESERFGFRDSASVGGTAPGKAPGEGPGGAEAAGGGTRGGGPDGSGDGSGSSPAPSPEEVFRGLEKRHANIDAAGDEMISRFSRGSGVEPHFRSINMETAKTNEAFAGVFDRFLKAVVVVAGVLGVLLALAIVVMVLRGFGEAFAGARTIRRATRAKPPKVARTGRAFEELGDPFAGAASEGFDAREGNVIVRRLWQATLAYCADCGDVCPPHLTPTEYVDARPAPLKGFEDSARFLADAFNFGEYSGRPIPAETMDGLRKYWNDLRERAKSGSA